MGIRILALFLQGVPIVVRILGILLCSLLVPSLAAPADDARGWGYLVDRLSADGIARERVLRAFGDPRMPSFTGLEFGLDAHEPRSLYRRFLGGASVAAAHRCRIEHAAALEAAERAYGVPARVVAAVLHVETGCGRNTGRSGILYAVARLAMANEPANLSANLERRPADQALAAKVRGRGRYLEDTFYPEVRATFVVAERLGVDPLDLRGSGSGAFGDAQFLPSSYLRYGIDADGDGQVDLYDFRDAAASCANYLAMNGWRQAASEAQRRAVIWRYNHSAAYIETVLALAHRIEQPCSRSTTVARHRSTRPTRKVRKADPPAALARADVR